MTIQEVLPFLQSLSALAIACGLIFTALQFRYAQRSQHVANFAKMVELQMHLREMRVHDPSLAAVYRHDLVGLQGERDIREYFFNLMQLSVFEIVWFAYEHGQLPRDYYESWVKRMRDIATEESFRRMIASPAMRILHDDFEQYIIRMVKEIKPDSSHAEAERR